MTLDKYTNLKKKSFEPFLRKSQKNKNLSCKCQLPMFRFKPKAWCTPSSLSFEFRDSETYGCKTQVGTYLHTHRPMDFWPLFGL